MINLVRNELIKITKTQNGVFIMPELSVSGRSAYICKNKDCIKTALKKDKIFKILKIEPLNSLKEKISTVLES